MTITRASRNLGPGHLLFGATLASKLFCKSIKAEIVTTFNDNLPGGFGRVGRSKTDELIRVSFTPTGEFSSDIAALLWPYGATAIGASIFGATDTAVAIQTLAGRRWTLHAAAVTKMPNIHLGGGQEMYGEFEITGIVKNNTARSAANAVMTEAAQAWSGVPTPASRVILPLTSASWALGSPESINAKNGWQIEFALELAWQVGADTGTFDALFMGVDVKAKCLPLNYADARIADLKIDGTGNDIGSNARSEADLTLIQPNPGATLVLKNASLDSLNPAFADGQDRFPEVVWRARRDVSASYGAIFTFAQTAGA